MSFGAHHVWEYASKTQIIAEITGQIGARLVSLDLPESGEYNEIVFLFLVLLLMEKVGGIVRVQI